MGTIEGDRAEEKKLHDHFRSDRVHAEWFLPSERLRAFLYNTFHEQLEQRRREVLAAPEILKEYAGLLGWTEAEVSQALREIGMMETVEPGVSAPQSSRTVSALATDGEAQEPAPGYDEATEKGRTA
jgi:hypothetical protein